MSSSSPQRTNARLRQRQLSRQYVFDLTITSATVGAEKPNPVIFRYAIHTAGAAPANSWMIGDNPIADVEGARMAGLSAILADGIYADAIGVTVLQAAEQIVAINPKPRPSTSTTLTTPNHPGSLR